jgi:hypothetical protein
MLGFEREGKMTTCPYHDTIPLIENNNNTQGYCEECKCWHELDEVEYLKKKVRGECNR